MKKRVSQVAGVSGVIISCVVLNIAQAATADPNDKVFWLSVCGANAADPVRLALGSGLQARCGQILNTPGSGAHSTASSTGSNFAISGGLSSSARAGDEGRKKQISDRIKELREKQKEGAAGDLLASERFGFFISGKTTDVDRKGTTLQSGYDAETNGFVAGIDYQFSDKFTAGLAAGYSNTDTDYDFSGGDQDVDAVSVMFYSNYSPINNLSLNGYVGWTGYDYDSKRNISIDSSNIDPATVLIINATANGKTEGDQLMVGAGVSYDFNMGAVTLTPQVSFDYSDTWIDGFTESESSGLGLKYRSQTITSYKTKAGIDLSHSNSFSWGILVPHAKLYHIHEYSDDSRTIHASFSQDNKAISVDSQSDSPDRDYLTFGFGVSAVLPHAIQLFVDFEKIEAHRYINSYTVSGGLRVGF